MSVSEVTRGTPVLEGGSRLVTKTRKLESRVFTLSESLEGLLEGCMLTNTRIAATYGSSRYDVEHHPVFFFTIGGIDLGNRGCF